MRPLMSSKICGSCRNTCTTTWHRVRGGQLMCNFCFVRSKQESLGGGSDAKSSRTSTESNSSDDNQSSSGRPAACSKMTTRSAGSCIHKKGRRNIFKTRRIDKGTSLQASVTTSDSVWHEGQLFQKGDVVSLTDRTDNRKYYARIVGFLVDWFCQKSVALNWLIPTTSSPTDGSFDPETFIDGPADNKWYSINSLAFERYGQLELYQKYCRTIDNDLS